MTRIVLYNALGDHERFERYGGVARRLKRKRGSVANEGPYKAPSTAKTAKCN
jgi:hypothetical protein